MAYFFFTGVINKMRSDPPTFWGVQSNGLGRCMVAILSRDPRRFNDIAAKLHGRQLPASLRTFIWMDGLYRKERQQTQRYEDIIWYLVEYQDAS